MEPRPRREPSSPVLLPSRLGVDFSVSDLSYTRQKMQRLGFRPFSLLRSLPAARSPSPTPPVSSVLGGLGHVPTPRGNSCSHDREALQLVPALALCPPYEGGWQSILPSAGHVKRV